MKGNEKFLLAIVLGVLLLLGVTFAVALLRPAPTYQSDEQPGGVAHNYLLALQRQEFERAYGYLSPTLKGYPPSADRFATDILDNRWNFEFNNNASVSVVVDSVKVISEEAVISIRQTTFYRDGSLSSQYTTTFTIRLRQTDGAWKLIDSESYWLNCWQEEEGCS
ncbi:MAG: hypothetical protein ACPGWR_03520 [Ardenticatenaceae bacterium]